MDNGTTNGNNGSTNAVASSSNAQAASSAAPNVDMVGVLGNLLKSHVGDVSNERMAQILIQNMTALVQQGKLNQNQLLQVEHPRILLDKCNEPISMFIF
jgi:transcription initiation factor TFIID subunit 12